MLKGIYTPIITPFNEKEEIDFKRMEHNLDRWVQTGLNGIVVLGSNGEFVYLNNQEKFKIINFVVEKIGNKKKIVVGTSCESTKETIAMVEQVAAIGVDAVLILPPHYYKGMMTADILEGYFIDIAEASPVPLMLYNMPGNTGINLTPNLISRLAKHPRIVGIKDTSGNIVQITEMIRDTAAEDFAVFAGNAGYLLPALSVGAKGATLALANVLPEACCELYSLFKKGCIEEARLLQHKLLEPNYTVTGLFGVPGLKVAMDLLGYQGGFPRRPLRVLSGENSKIVVDVFKNYSY